MISSETSRTKSYSTRAVDVNSFRKKVAPIGKVVERWLLFLLTMNRNLSNIIVRLNHGAGMNYSNGVAGRGGEEAHKECRECLMERRKE